MLAQAHAVALAFSIVLVTPFAQAATLSPAATAKVLEAYSFLDPDHQVDKQLLQKAIVYLAANRVEFANRNYLTVVDFGLPSNQARLFVVNLKDGSVDAYHTSHGNGSIEQGADEAIATKFGDVPESNQTPLGFVRTAEVYYGSLGRSLRLHGLSSTNQNIAARGIVLHSDNRMQERNVVEPLSGGCVMLDPAVRDEVIAKLRGGSLMLWGVSRN